jgi:hypothetical protein
MIDDRPTRDIGQIVEDSDSRSFMRKVATKAKDFMKSWYGKAIGYAGLGLLAATAAYADDIGKGQQLAKNEADKSGYTEMAAKEGIRLPDLSGAKYLGAKTFDGFQSIPGEESVVKGYWFADMKRQVITYELPNGKIYSFATQDKSGTKWFNDADNDGIFETEGKQADIKLPKYGYSENI